MYLEKIEQLITQLLDREIFDIFKEMVLLLSC